MCEVNTFSLSDYPERFTASTPVALVGHCMNLDGSHKAALIRRINENPITVEIFGRYEWEVWDESSPDTVTLFLDEARARELFKTCMLAGTNPVEKGTK